MIQTWVTAREKPAGASFSTDLIRSLWRVQFWCRYAITDARLVAISLIDSFLSKLSTYLVRQSAGVGTACAVSDCSRLLLLLRGCDVVCRTLMSARLVVALRPSPRINRTFLRAHASLADSSHLNTLGLRVLRGRRFKGLRPSTFCMTRKLGF